MFDQMKSETIRKIQMQLLKNSMRDFDRDKSWGLLNVQTNKLKDFFISSMFTIPLKGKISHVLSECGNKVASLLKGDTVFHLPKFIDIFSEMYNSS